MCWVLHRILQTGYFCGSMNHPSGNLYVLLSPCARVYFFLPNSSAPVSKSVKSSLGSGQVPWQQCGYIEASWKGGSCIRQVVSRAGCMKSGPGRRVSADLVFLLTEWPLIVCGGGCRENLPMPLEDASLKNFILLLSY